MLTKRQLMLTLNGFEIDDDAIDEQLSITGDRLYIDTIGVTGDDAVEYAELRDSVQSEIVRLYNRKPLAD